MIGLSLIDIVEFRKIDMRVGLVEEAERVKGSDRLIKMVVNFGDFKKKAVAGLGHLYDPKDFVGKKFVFVVNLKPKTVRGEVSECMLLAAAESENTIVPIAPISDIKEGVQVL